MFFNQYPYINVNDLNLDYILRAIKELKVQLDNFVSLNTIKYADPIQWNITYQYEANTVVLDALTGTAYLSKRPVPSGVALTNTDYWQVIFTLDLLDINNNITLRDDGFNVIATFASNTGDWLLWNNILYKVTQPISINTAYVVGFNLDRYTVELFINDYVTALTTAIGDLNDLTTSDKSSLVNAINELAVAAGNVKSYNTVADMIADTNLTVGNMALTAGYYFADDNGAGDYIIVNTAPLIGHYETLTNGLYAELIVNEEVNVKSMGAVGDGITDDTASIQAAITDYKKIYIPSGEYLITSPLTLHDNVEVYGAGANRWAYGNGTTLNAAGTCFSLYDNRRVSIHDFNIAGNSTGTGFNIDGSSFTISIENVVVKTPAVGIKIDSGWNYTFKELIVESATDTGFKIAQGTSASLIDCLAYNCVNVGFDIAGLTYTSLVNCGSDGSAIGFKVGTDCRGVSFISCGVEHATVNCWQFSGINIAASVISPNIGNHSTMAGYIFKFEQTDEYVTIYDTKIATSFTPAAPYGVIDNTIGASLSVFNSMLGSRPGTLNALLLSNDTDSEFKKGVKAKKFVTQEGTTGSFANDSRTLTTVDKNSNYIICARATGSSLVYQMAAVSIPNDYTVCSIVPFNTDNTLSFSINSDGDLILTSTSGTSRAYNWNIIKL